MDMFAMEFLFVYFPSLCSRKSVYVFMLSFKVLNSDLFCN